MRRRVRQVARVRLVLRRARQHRREVRLRLLPVVPGRGRVACQRVRPATGRGSRPVADRLPGGTRHRSQITAAVVAGQPLRPLPVRQADPGRRAAVARRRQPVHERRDRRVGGRAEQGRRRGSAADHRAAKAEVRAHVQLRRPAAGQRSPVGLVHPAKSYQPITVSNRRRNGEGGSPDCLRETRLLALTR